MRTDFVGATLEGHYGGGQAWVETYTSDGRLDYRERERHAVGNWHFRGPVFCTFYDRAHQDAFRGGCWIVIKTSPNCYEFFAAPPGSPSDATERPAHWNARGWRRSEPSTCQDRPSV